MQLTEHFFHNTYHSKHKNWIFYLKDFFSKFEGIGK